MINPENVLDQFEELIPGAADHGEDYLRAVRKQVQACRAPVVIDVREIALTSGVFAPKQICLITTPDDPRLRKFDLVHYASPLGTSLKVGWYLVGGTKAKGLGGFTALGGATQLDMDNLKPVVHLVHLQAVAPAMREIATAASASGGRGGGGFFGTSDPSSTS